MDSNNLNILVEAKKEYMDQLCMIMGPLMIQTFMDIYSEAHKMSKGKKVLIQYQKLLKEVPNWNNHIVKEHSSKLCDSCSWFSDLLAAVFVSCVKILSSVRLMQKTKKYQSSYLQMKFLFMGAMWKRPKTSIKTHTFITMTTQTMRETRSLQTVSEHALKRL